MGDPSSLIPCAGRHNLNHWTTRDANAKSLQSCPTLRPHRRQPTRLPRPWDSPGKNTGVGCHFLLQCMKVKSKSEVAQWCPTLKQPHGLQPTGLLCPWEFPGKSTGVGCHCFSGTTREVPPLLTFQWTVCMCLIAFVEAFYIIWIQLFPKYRASMFPRLQTVF